MSIAVDLIIIGNPYVRVTEKVATLKIWLIASLMPSISLYKDGKQLDVTDQHKYGIKRTPVSLELMLYNPTIKDYGEYNIHLLSMAGREVRDLTVTLSKPLGKFIVSFS